MTRVATGAFAPSRGTKKNAPGRHPMAALPASAKPGTQAPAFTAA